MFNLKHFLRKLYHLIAFLGVFILVFIPTVRADSIPSCYDDYLVDIDIISGTKYFSNDSWVNHSSSRSFSNGKTITYLFPRTESDLYIKFFDSSLIYDSFNITLTGYSSDKVATFMKKFSLTNLSYCSSSNNDWCFDYSVENNQLHFYGPATSAFAKSSYISIAFGEPFPFSDSISFIAVSSSDFSSLNCSSANFDNPSAISNIPSETDGIKIFTNFYSIFIDKLSFLSEYFVTNMLFLGFIGVIVLIIVLELFLILFKGGGYKK